MNAAVNFSPEHIRQVLLLRVKHPLMQQHTPLRRRTDQKPRRFPREQIVARMYRIHLAGINRERRECMYGKQLHAGQEL